MHSFFREYFIQFAFSFNTDRPPNPYFWGGENEKIANEILPALVPALSLGRNGSKSVLRGGVAKEKRVP